LATRDIIISLKSTQEIARELASRIRGRRLHRTWTQAELARRAGLKLPTYVVFERSGRIALSRLLKVAEVLDLLDDFDRIARGEDLTRTTLAELITPERKRGRRRK
jgi:transcriptional regulator with XRE-family HTH domain